MQPTRVAIIGGGLAGLTCATVLGDAGFDVTVFDKGRGVGGRTSVRRDGPWRFDHGAPRLELGAPALAADRARWEAAGVIARWQPRVRTSTTTSELATWLGVPGSNALAVHLAGGLRVVTNARVVSLARTDKWRLEIEHDGAAATVGPFELVVVTAPTPQAITLLATANADTLASMLAPAVFVPCVVAMLAVQPASANIIDEIRTTEGPLASAHRLDERPGRTRAEGVELWVAHGSEAWSAARLEDDADVSARELAAAMTRLLAGDVLHARGHRWRYARATTRIAAPFVYDEALQLGVAGDGFDPEDPAPAASRAVLSGRAFAARVIAAR